MAGEPAGALRFGTDGVRGVANAELTPEFALLLGRVAARELGGRSFLVGRDTRRSGPLLQHAFCVGLASEGVEAVDLGVLPTPALAWESAASNLPAAMISASHNAFADNGIKLFSAGGRKLDDAVERRIEAALAAPLDGERPSGLGVGTFRRQDQTGYADALVSSLSGRRLAGLRVVLDCANGAACDVAPEVLERLGAHVQVLHHAPNGANINDGCGSTHPESLGAAVVAAKAHVGLAFDGDADRVLAVDGRGQLVDGDEILVMCALDLRARALLHADTVVVTVMSNLGLRRALADADIHVVETKVGDRYVLDALESGGFSLGGEQSGHIIFRDWATTGDGLLTGIAVLDLMRRSGRMLQDLAAQMTRYPQVLRNVPGANRELLDGCEPLWSAVKAEEAQLAGDGRVLVRPSGTEPLVRVMVEAATREQADEVCDRLCAVVTRELVLPVAGAPAGDGADGGGSSGAVQ